MREPISIRNNIPLFYPKSEKEFQEDLYERYDPMVLRQSALHLTDELWGHYPFDPIMTFAQKSIAEKNPSNIVELGCGVGRWIGTIANEFPQSNCWGIDYSYQMLKQAKKVWCSDDAVYLNLARYGFSTSQELKQKPLDNLQFGLSRGEDLPFEDDSQDLVLSSFLFDRLTDPIQGLKEMKRILKPGGLLIFVTPLNFNKAKHWELFYPPIKIHKIIDQLGLRLVNWEEDLTVEEPLDRRGNMVRWNCIGVVAQNI